MQYIVRIVLLVSVFLVMILIGDHLLHNTLNASPAFRPWGGFLFAFAVSAIFFRSELFELLLYLCGAIVLVAILQYIGIDVLGAFNLRSEILNNSKLFDSLRELVP